jgi:predicted peptidase
VAFHGKGEFGSGELSTLGSLTGNMTEFLKRVDTYGFSVLAPQVNTKLTDGALWWSDVHVKAIFDYAIANHTKLGKVAETGLSQGGGTCWEGLTNEETASKLFASIPICPTSQYGDNIVNKNDFSLIAKYKIAVWNFCAADDTTVWPASSRNMVAKANSYNPDPKVKYTEYPTGGHAIWGRVWATEEIYPWLLSYAPTGTVVTPPPPAEEILYTIKTTIYKSGKIETVKL